MELNGSRVLVTGASGGIGEALVEQLCKAGAQVLAVGRDADKLAAAEQRFPHALRALAADLTRLDREFRRLSYAHMQHHAIFEALANRQSARAEALMREHANATMAHVDFAYGGE